MLPIGFLFFETGGFQEFNNVVTDNTNIVTVMTQMYTFTFPSINFWFARLLNLLQILSTLVLYLLIRG